MSESIDKLLPYEHNLFLTLNGSDSVFWDNAMWAFTGLITWLPMALVILYLLFKNQAFKEGLLVSASIILVFILASFASSFCFKPLFERYRPTHHPDYKDIVKIVNDFRGGSYGFISGHATNSFAIAFLFSFIFRNHLVTTSLILWATLNSYSRVYLGVHFISDIIAGFIVGFLIGYSVYILYRKTREKYFKTPYSKTNQSIYSPVQGNVIGIFVISYTALVILLSPLFSSLSYLLLPDGWF